MKKLLIMAVFGLAGLAAFAGTCTITHISLVKTDGTHKTFAGQLDNSSGVNILQHNFVVAFLDSANGLVETKSVSGCLRSVQNNQTDFFSATSTSSASSVSTGLARLAFDSTFKVGTTSSQDVTISEVTAGRSGTTLTVKGKVTNNSSSKLYAPNACIVVRTSADNVLITDLDETMSDLAKDAFDTFSQTIKVPDDSTADSVDIWVDGLDSDDNPTTPESKTNNNVNEGGTADKLSFSTQPVGGVIINTAFTTQPVVKILDINGDVVTSGSDATKNVTLAVTAASAPAGSVLTCTNNTVAAVAGVATFAACKLNHAGTGITLTATATGATSAVSSALSITPGAATALAFKTSPAGATGGTAFTTQPVVVVQDANGDTVWTGTNSTASVTLTEPGAGTFSCTTNPVVAVAGVATFAGCKINEAAAGYQLKANGGAPALGEGTSSSFTVAVGAAAKLAINQPSNAVSGVAFAPNQPIVTVQDAGGNTVTTSTASITLSASAGTLACTNVGNLTMAAVAGVATLFTGCNITGVGAPTITAASSGLTSAVTAAITIS